MTEKIKIHMMGGFYLESEGHMYDNLVSKTRRGVSLLQLLILERGKTVSSRRLIRELWTGSRSENPENALKTMVCRVRAMLNGISEKLGDCIHSEQGGYRWEITDHISVDALEIISIIERLKTDIPARTQAKLTKELQCLYVGDLFQTGDINNGVSQVNLLHREYIEAVLKYVELLKKNEEYNEIYKVCRKALLIDNLDDQLHIELMQAMVNLNRASEAMAEYSKVVKTQRMALDAEISDEMAAYYSRLAEEGKTLKFNLDVIRNELGQQDKGRGPFFCDYRAFKMIYNIQMRNIERLGSTMFLGVIMLASESNVSRESGMAGMQEILRSNLRKGDIVTRFSDNIYAMLLPTVNYSTGSKVMDRIKDLFQTEYPAGNIALHTRISPLGGDR
ncbi:MAG: winged helix-turn-helix domain-containing protein [Clostridiales bacterium]|nr:winged helix-turn-helix domain-containing protein [Clostridiales bacterium]